MEECIVVSYKCTMERIASVDCNTYCLTCSGSKFMFDHTEMLQPFTDRKDSCNVVETKVAYVYVILFYRVNIDFILKLL